MSATNPSLVHNAARSRNLGRKSPREGYWPINRHTASALTNTTGRERKVSYRESKKGKGNIRKLTDNNADTIGVISTQKETPKAYMLESAYESVLDGFYTKIHARVKKEIVHMDWSLPLIPHLLLHLVLTSPCILHHALLYCSLLLYLQEDYAAVFTFRIVQIQFPADFTECVRQGLIKT